MELAQGDADGFNYLFFPERAICLSVFELGRTYRAMQECPQADAAALMNAVYQDFPDYVAEFNLTGCVREPCSLAFGLYKVAQKGFDSLALALQIA